MAHPIERRRFIGLDLLSRVPIQDYIDIEWALARDNSTFVVRWNRPFDGRDWWTTYYPKHLLDSLDVERMEDWAFWDQPVGNGPYRFVRHVPETMFELEANRDYYRGQPRIDRLIIKLRGTATAMELQSGGVDASMYVNRADIPYLRADPQLILYYAIFPEVGWREGIYWNHRHPILGDARIRRALTMAIDRAELRKLQNLPDGLPIFDVLFTASQFWAGDLPKPLPYDPDAASRTLADAGWKDGNGDGILEKDRAFRFTAIFKAVVHNRRMAGSRRRCTFRLRFAEWEWTCRSRRSRRGIFDRLAAGEFDAAFYTFSASNAEREFGFMGYGDSAFRAQLQAAGLEMDSLRRDSLYRAMAPRLARGVPITFLGPEVRFFVANRRLKGLSSPFRARPLEHLEHLWIEEGR